MHLKAQRPIFVPYEHRREIEEMSKAALMDLVWDFAVTAGPHTNDSETMATLRARRDIILEHRKQARNR